MRPVSDRFLRTVRGSHTAVFRAKICATWQTGVGPVGVEIPIVAGDVQMDGAAAIRSTLDLTTDGRAMWPERADGLLAPYGNELHIARGISFGNGTTEWVSLGYHRIQAAEQENAPDGPIRLSARDRMAGIVDARLLAPIQFAATDTFGAVTEALVREVCPEATIEWDDPAARDRQIGRSVIAEEERYDVLKELWDSVGKTGHWDHRGVLVIRTPPDPAAPVWEVNAGEGGVLVAMARELSRDSVYNGVAAYGEAADTETPPRAVAVDDDSRSPTWWYGRFGKVPRYYSSPFITTVAQARSAAVSMLRQQLGLPYTVDFAAVPNPALEPGDPVRITYSSRRAPETHVLESLTIPLTVEEPVTAKTREQARILIGML
ncbi:DUF5047 domain-containing protein [Rhizomonospora bruguierae]|uniref:DUF5047 domain-containing protein n=1 Tax=Rhizomonospora bruguierae TaxID=1581705 RepID=UPI001BCC8A15|nr:DUF5047 domain-containing protein [Micromonospora sp. NBRC 107566]